MGLGSGTALASASSGLDAPCPAEGCQAKAVGTFSSREECQDRAWYYKQDQPLLGYYCSSNGNPSTTGPSTWTLYQANFNGQYVD